MKAERLSQFENRKPGPTSQFGRWTSQLVFEFIPEKVVEHTKLCLLDSFGCGLFGSTQKWGQIMSEVAVGLSGGGASSLWGQHATASPSDTALVNGTAIHGYEIDDVHLRALMHPGAVTIPPVLALAEARNMSGKDLLTAVVAGYEIGVRVNMCAGIPHTMRGYHPTGTGGCLCAAAGVANLLKLSAEQSTHALAIAATQAAGLNSAVQSGAMTKRMHAGRAAQCGVLSGLLAERGFTGSPDVLETPASGYMSTLSEGQDLAPFVESLGRDWETSEVGFKVYSACASAHTTIDAIDTLIKRGLSAENLEHLTVRMSKVGLNNVGWPYRPTSVTGAQMNGYFAAAVKLIDGEAFISQYREDRIGDPAILKLIEKIELTHDPELDIGGAAKRHAVKVEARIMNGETLHEYIEQRRGSSEHPLHRIEIENKFRLTAGSVLSPDKVEDLLNCVWTLEGIQDVRSLCAILRN